MITISNIAGAFVALLLVLPTPVLSWIPSTNRRYGLFSSGNVVSTTIPSTSDCSQRDETVSASRLWAFSSSSWLPATRTSLFSTPSDEATDAATTNADISDSDTKGDSQKTIYQRTFYRLTPGSQVTVPNAIIIEERLRFRPDPDHTDRVLPYGPRTLIVREGSDKDELTDELFRMDVVIPSSSDDEGRHPLPHNGPRTMDTEIASILYLASNPQWIQGDVLELSCGKGVTGPTGTAAGVVGLLGCISARLVTMSPDEVARYKQQQKYDSEVENNVMTVPSTSLSDSNLRHNPFPKRMHHLTLSDGNSEALRRALPLVQRYASPSRVSLKEVPWNVPRRQNAPNRRRPHHDHEYRTIIGSDLEVTYPTARELARTVANMLLPSNEFAVANIREGADTAPSFGALGMDPEPSPTSYKENRDEQVDPSVPPTFIHICPDHRDDLVYLRQFLEKGFLMTVTSGYVKMERLQFVPHTLPDGTPEEELDVLDDLELHEEGASTYQSLTAIHHPDYAGEGSGEYFFPLETGAYEGGAASSPYLEPEAGGYPSL